MAAAFSAQAAPAGTSADAAGAADPLSLKVEAILAAEANAAAQLTPLQSPDEQLAALLSALESARAAEAAKTASPADVKTAASSPEAAAGAGGKLAGRLGNLATTTSDLLLTSMSFLGVPYRWGGTDPLTGFDCSGFVRAVYEKASGLVLPRVAKDQAQATQRIDRKDLKPGDLVFFNTLRRAFSHVGIYMGDGKFIHAPKPGDQVRIDDMNKSYWQAKFNGARRVLDTKVAARAGTKPATQ